MALSDCYMLRDVQTFNGEKVLNVYFYQDLLLAATAETLVDAWVAGVQPKVLDIQDVIVRHILVDAVNLADPANFFEFAQDVGGEYDGDALPPHCAVSYGLRLNSRALRPGSKRYTGIPEAVQVNGTITNSTYITQMEALRVQQSDILLSGVLSTFQPIVVKRVPYTPEGSPEGHIAYRLPEDDGEFVFGNVIEALTTTHVSHQVSRGNGR